jgi:hypothetical protein
METREQRRQILNSAVEQFLDHLEEDFDKNEDFTECALSSVVVAGEIFTTTEGDETVVPSYWCSNENKIWARGFFELLTDYFRINVPVD